jgi:hypothetical protein
MSTAPARTRLLETRMEARESQLRLAAEIAGFGVWTLEPGTGEISCSPHFLSLLRVEAGTTADFDGLLRLIDAEDCPRVRRAFAQALRVHDDFTVEFRLAGGGDVLLRCTGRAHASSLDTQRRALSGVLQAVAAQPATVDDYAHRMGAMVNRLESLRDLDRGTLAMRVQSEFAPHLLEMQERIAMLSANDSLTPALHEELVRISDAALLCLDAMRQAIFEMRPPGVVELGLAGALERYASERTAASGIDLSLDLSSEAPPVDLLAQEALYAAARVGIDNVMSHAHAQRMALRLVCGTDALVLTIDDDGVGIHDRDLMKDSACGLFAASERLASTGGELRIFANAGGGTLLEARVALRPQTRRQLRVRTTPLRVA